jgi:hypothetical protein
LLLSKLGDVLTVAEVAGVMAAKRSADLLPHRLTPPITKVCSSLFPPVIFWYWSRSADLCLWLVDPDRDRDPAIFVLDLQDANKKPFSLAFQFFFFCCFKAPPARPAHHQGPLQQYMLPPSVADLNPDAVPDPLVGGYGSGSFYHQAKIVRKTLIPTGLWLLFEFLSLKNDVNVPSKSNKQ